MFLQCGIYRPPSLCLSWLGFRVKGFGLGVEDLGFRVGLLSCVSGLTTYGCQVDASLNGSFPGVLPYFGAPRKILKVCVINPP